MQLHRLILLSCLCFSLPAYGNQPLPTFAEEFAALRKQIDALKAAQDDAKQTDEQEEIAHLREEIKNNNALIHTLQQTLAEKDNLLIQLKDRLVELFEENTQLREAQGIQEPPARDSAPSTIDLIHTATSFIDMANQGLQFFDMCKKFMPSTSTTSRGTKPQKPTPKPKAPKPSAPKPKNSAQQNPDLPKPPTGFGNNLGGFGSSNSGFFNELPRLPNPFTPPRSSSGLHHLLDHDEDNAHTGLLNLLSSNHNSDTLKPRSRPLSSWFSSHTQPNSLFPTSPFGLSSPEASLNTSRFSLSSFDYPSLDNNPKIW